MKIEGKWLILKNAVIKRKEISAIAFYKFPVIGDPYVDIFIDGRKTPIRYKCTYTNYKKLLLGFVEIRTGGPK